MTATPGTDVNSSCNTKIPLPIQSFLWIQSDTFFREKIHDRFKQTCKSLELVIVNNVIHDPQSLYDASKKVSRWVLVGASLPHVMHCLAILLAKRHELEEEDELEEHSIRLLHTLQWILLEGFDECNKNGSISESNITLKDICLFIHFLAPVTNCLTDSDLTCKLAVGQEIWQPMWNYESPRIPTFMSTVTSSGKKPEIASNCSQCFEFQKSNNIDPIPVIVCDIAVISCLLNERWSEAGVLWGINYILKKLQNSSDKKEQEGRLPHRRSRSMVDRHRRSSILKSMSHLPVQKESTADTRLEESKSAVNLRDTLKETKKQTKFTSQYRFRSQKKDEPPSYSAATANHPFFTKTKTERKKSFFGKSSRTKSRTDSEISISIPPPKYAETIADTNDGIEITFPKNNTVPSTSGLPQQQENFNSMETTESNEEITKRRWRSDSSLNYKKNESALSLKTASKYIEENGSLRLDVILAVVDVVVSNVPRTPLLEICLQLLVHAYDRLEATREEQKKSSRISGEEAKDKETICVKIFLRILHNLTLIFGCTNACSGHRDNIQEKMRMKTRHLLNTMFLMHRDHYQNHIKNVMKTNSLRNIINFMHSLVSFCIVDVNMVAVNEVTDEVLSLDSQITNKLEDFVIKFAFRELVLKCVNLQSSLLSSENENLYTEVRNLIQFVRIHHPSTFNEVLLTVMLVPTKKRRKWEQEKGKEKLAEEIKQLKKKVSSQELPKSFKNQRRGAVALTSSPLINSKSEDRKKQGFSYPSKTKDTPKGRNHSFDSRLLLGSKKSFSYDSDSSDGEDNDESKCRNRTQSVLGKILNKMTKDYTGMSLNAKKSSEKDSVLGIASTIKGHMIPFFKLAEPHSEEKKTEYEVETDDLCIGVKILQFLMDACPPGTVPNASILGSVMGLYSPVICRFVVLLHCAQFVDRGINGNWPRWLNHRSFQRRSSGKDIKGHFYTAARILFYKWGTELNKFLEKIIAVNNDPCKVLGDVTNPEDKLRYRNEDLKEDFTKDVRINASGKECSIPLQMAASNLLYQITTFLKDTSRDTLNSKESCISTELGSRIEVNQPTPSASRCDDYPTKKTIKFQHSTEFIHATTLNLPGGAAGLKRATSLLSDKHPPQKLEGRRSSATNASDEHKPSLVKSQHTSNRKPSIPMGSNTLAVPAGNVLSGETASFSSYGDLSYGSTLSLGAASATSEYVRDNGEAVLSPNICLGNLSSFNFGSLPVIDPTIRCKELPWMKSMIQLANQQNLLCDHIYFCHPFCHKRMIRSCNRIVATLKNIFENYEKNKDELAKFRGQSTDDFKDKYSKDVERATHIQLTDYLKTKSQCLAGAPLLTLMKAITTLSCEMLIDLHALSWEILLDSNKLLVEAAASLFLLCAIKIRSDVYKSVMAELNHKDPDQRINALRKIRILWEYRKSVWKYAENHARESREAGFTFPASNTSFSFSISALGLGSTALPDPPWLPHIVDVDEMVAQSGASRSAALLTTDSLAYQKEQEIKQLLLQEEEERSEARKSFQFVNIPVVQQIVVEAKRKIGHEVEEQINENRRYSCRPVNTGINQSNADFRKEGTCRSTRSSVVHNLRSSHVDNSLNAENIPRPNSSVFPPSLGDCVPTVLQLIADASTSQQGEQSVGSVASCVVSSCLNEDANLFLRCIAEKLLNKLERFKALRLLRKLPSLLPDLSPSVANSIFNQVVECIIHYNRGSPVRERIIAPSAIAMASVFPFIESVDLKTMKQTLRKEQIDIQLLITAGFQGTKKLTVWNQGEFYMPDQIEVGDRSSFAHVLQEAVDSLGVPKSDHHLYQLLDRKNEQLLCQHCYVRDFYMFKKSASNSESPEVTLVKMNLDEGERKLSHRVVELKLAEIGKLRFTIEGLFCQKNLTDKELNATYLQDEFKRLWSFPRKAIDGEFFLFDGKYGKEIRSLDAIQKYYWADLISSIMLSLSSEFPWENDLIFFLHVWSAALVVHSEHVTILRRIMAAFIDAIVHFSRTFTFRGYSLILPSMLRVYSKHYKNGVIRRCLDFTFFQMFDVHRQPFLLQLFASAALLLAEYNWQITASGDKHKELISPSNFFHLLLALTEAKPVDEIQVMSLVKAEKPLKPADKCLETDDVSISFGNYFRLCVTVIAYQPESGTCLEMLIVLNSILPCYLQHIRSTLSPNEEISRIQDIGIYIRFLLASVEVLTKSISTSSPGQQQSQQPPQTHHSIIHSFFNSKKHGSTKTIDNKLEDGKEKDDSQENRPMMEEYIAPRDVLLQLCTTFYKNAVSRFSQLKNKFRRQILNASFDDIFNAKSHIRLAEVAQSLLKLFTDENIASVSFGLAFYMENMLPVVDWSVEAVRPALFIVLKRMDRFLNKIDRNFAFRKNHNWKTLSMMYSGINTLLTQQPIVTHISHLKGIVTASITLQIGDAASSDEHAVHLPPEVTTKVIKLIVLYVQGSGESASLEDIVSPLIQKVKRESIILNLVIPISLCTAADLPLDAQNEFEAKKNKLSMKLTTNDVFYMVNLCTNALMGKRRPPKQNVTSLLLAASPKVERNNVIGQRVLCLALKVLISCFHHKLHGEWQKLARTLREIIYQHITGPAIWKFVVFFMRYKTPLLASLKTFVVRQFLKRPAGNVEEMAQKLILEKILLQRDYKPIRLSLIIKDFVEEAQELRKQLLTGNASSHSQKPKLSFSIPKSPNVNPEVHENDRSRKTSFRQAVTPNKSPDVVKYSEEHRKQRASLPVTRSRSRKSTPSPNPQTSKESGLQSSITVPVKYWSELKNHPPVPDIKVEVCETPLNFATNSKCDQFLRESGSVPMKNSSSTSQTKERNRRVTISETTSFLSRPYNHQIIETQSSSNDAGNGSNAATPENKSCDKITNNAAVQPLNQINSFVN